LNTSHWAIFENQKKTQFVLLFGKFMVEIGTYENDDLLGTDSQEYMASLPKVLQTEGTAMIPSHLFASCTSLDSHPVGLLCQS
jgi:hypothetical protein